MKRQILLVAVSFTGAFMGTITSWWFRGRRRNVDPDRIPNVCTTCWQINCCKECPDWPDR